MKRFFGFLLCALSEEFRFMICSYVYSNTFAHFNSDVLNLNFSVYKTLTTASHLECCHYCAQDAECVAAVLKEENPTTCNLFIENLNGDGNVASTTGQILWVRDEASAEERSNVENISCPADFSQTSVGCFYVDDSGTFAWDDAETICRALGPNGRLAVLNTLKVDLNELLSFSSDKHLCGYVCETKLK